MFVTAIPVPLLLTSVFLASTISLRESKPAHANRHRPVVTDSTPALVNHGGGECCEIASSAKSSGTVERLEDSFPYPIPNCLQPRSSTNFEDLTYHWLERNIMVPLSDTVENIEEEMKNAIRKCDYDIVVIESTRPTSHLALSIGPLKLDSSSPVLIA